MKTNLASLVAAAVCAVPCLCVSAADFTIENDDFRLVVGDDACVKSLAVKDAGPSVRQRAQANFRHPSCITRSILKTRVVRRENGESTIAVTAHGYRGVERVDYKEVYGGDGNWHQVAVHWTEYLPVQRTCNMCLSERDKPSDVFRKRAAASRESAFRRSILSFLSSA